MQYMVDGAAGGNLVEHTVEKATELFELLGVNSQLKSARKIKRGGAAAAQGYQMDEVVHQLEDISSKLTAKTGSTHEAEQCSWCDEFGHSSMVCPNFGNVEGEGEQAKVVYSRFNGNQGQQRRFEPIVNTYNAGARHPNLSWRSNNVLQPTEGLNVPRPAFNPAFGQQG